MKRLQAGDLDAFFRAHPDEVLGRFQVDQIHVPSKNDYQFATEIGPVEIVSFPSKDELDPIKPPFSYGVPEGIWSNFPIGR